MDVSEEAVTEIARLARDAAGQMMTIDGRTFVLRHGAMALEEVTDKATWRAALPSRVRETVQLTTKRSLIDYVREFGRPETRLFADLDKASVSAVLDYHSNHVAADQAMAVLPIGVGACEHAAVLLLQVSDEWSRWAAINDKLMPQAEFVRFLEENAVDVVEPTSADLMEIVRDFSAARKVNFASAVRLDSGDISFEYSAQTDARSKSGQIEAPRRLMLQIPVFYGEPAVTLGAFLRWSIDDGALKLGVALHRMRYVHTAVFEQIATELQEECGRRVFFGVRRG